MNAGRIAFIEWVDSSIQNGQVDRSDYPVPEVIRSTGWLVAETDEHVTIARDDMKDDEYRGLLCIPRECLRSLRLSPFTEELR